LRGNVFFDALRHGGTTDYIAAKKIFCFYYVARIIFGISIFNADFIDCSSNKKKIILN